MLSEYGLCSVSLNNKLYLVGGQTTITDCYDPERDEWRQLSVMKERRMECGAVVINGCIYVTGGYSYSKGTYLQSIEKYDPEHSKHRAAFGFTVCCVFECTFTTNLN
jgi:kelch-like protein 23